MYFWRQRLVSSSANWYSICWNHFFPFMYSLHRKKYGACLVIDKNLWENKGFNSFGLCFHLFFSYKYSVWIQLLYICLYISQDKHTFITAVVDRLLHTKIYLECLFYIPLPARPMKIWGLLIWFLTPKASDAYGGWSVALWAVRPSVSCDRWSQAIR